MSIIGPQVAFVDDVQRDIQPLFDAVQKLDTGSVFFDATPDRAKYPARPYDTVKILFLDLYYTAQFDVTFPARWVQSIISPGSKYALVVWSKDTDQTKALLEQLEAINLKPAFMEAWQKTNFDLAKHDFVRNVQELADKVSDVMKSDNIYEVIDELFGQIDEVTPEGVFINCRLSEDSFQLRRFDLKLLENVKNLKEGTFVVIRIYTRAGARMVEILKDENDRSDYFKEKDYFKGTEGSRFFVEG